PESVVDLTKLMTRDEGTGVVDEYVDAAEGAGGGFGDIACAGRGRQISRQSAARASEILRTLSQTAGAIGAGAVVDKNIAAGVEQRFADGEADALRPGRDEGAFSGEFVGRGGHGRRLSWSKNLRSSSGPLLFHSGTS